VTPDEIDDMNTVDLEALIKRKAEHLARLRQEEEKCKKMIDINHTSKSNKSVKDPSCPKTSQDSDKAGSARSNRQNSDKLKDLFENRDTEKDRITFRSPVNHEIKGEVKVSPVTRSSSSARSASKLRSEVDFTSVAGISSILRDQLVPGSHISPRSGIIQTPVSKTKKEADSAATESAYDVS
jgi:hypothetical protein